MKKKQKKTNYPVSSHENPRQKENWVNPWNPKGKGKTEPTHSNEVETK